LCPRIANPSSINHTASINPDGIIGAQQVTGLLTERRQRLAACHDGAHIKNDFTGRPPGKPAPDVAVPQAGTLLANPEETGTPVASLALNAPDATG